MDTELNIKEEKSLPDDVVSQSETEFFRKVVSMKRSSGAVVLDEHCVVPIKTEIKSEAPFIKQVKCETVTCSNNWEIDRKAVIHEETLISDFGSQCERELLSEDPVTKLGKFYSGHEMGNKIEIKEEPLWLETETSAMCDNIKNGDFPPVKYSRLVPEINNSNIRSSNNFEMDTKLQIKEEKSLPDDADPQNETKFFRNVVSIKRSSEVLVNDHCDETEIKLEAPFTKHLVKRIKSEAVTCPDNWEMDRKAVIDEQTLISDSSSPSRREGPSEEPVTKLGKFNTGHEMDNKIEIKEEPLWLETETTATDNNKDGDCPPVKCSRICTDTVSGALSDKSSLLPPEVSEGDISFCNGKDRLECEHLKSDATEMPTAEKHVPSEQSGRYIEGGEMCIRPLFLKQKSLIHQGKRPHVCKSCDKSFTCLSHFKIHNLIHEGKKPHHCKQCGKSFTLLPSLKKHNLIHEGKKPHKCKLCDKSFTQLSNLKTHYLIHEGKKPHQCKLCDKSFTQLSHLKTHYLIHEGKKPHQCKLCDKSITNLSNLKTHYLIHEGKKPHQCKLCDKSFTQLSHLKTHYFIHEGKKPHQCKLCDKSFTLLSSLKKHNLIHEGKKPHQCKLCGKSFTNLSNLKTHYLIHEGKKPHQCKQCGKSFTLLSSLKNHNLIHEGKKPHQCKLCDKSFIHLWNLKKHNLIHEGKKLHQCKLCDKSFTLLSNLKRHYLIHEGKKPHQCKLCDKSFIHLWNLKKHNLIHEGQKLHQCKLCDKSFTQLSNLKRHYLIHEGKKPHQCKLCDKSFTELSNLKRHYLIHKDY